MPHKRNQTLLLGLIVGGVAFSLFLAGSCLVGVLVLSPGDGPVGVAGDKPVDGDPSRSKLTMDEFEQDVMGKSMDYVQDKYGPPDSVIQGYWNYQNIAVVGRDTVVTFALKKGTLTKLDHDQKLVTADDGKGRMVVERHIKKGRLNHAALAFFRGRVSKIEWAVPTDQKIYDRESAFHFARP